MTAKTLQTAKPSVADIKAALKDMKRFMETMHPNHAHADENAGWQERKSGQTRIALLSAAVECLARHGYARTTTQLVAATAKISRGAMLHHYATKGDLISSVIDYIMYRRMETFYGQISALTDSERLAVANGVEIYWNTVQTSEYEAYLELSIAARTDSDLREVFDAKAQAFDSYWFDQLTIFFPEWKARPIEDLMLARDMIVVTLEGLYMNRRIMTERDRRLAVRALLGSTIAMLRDDEIEVRQAP